MNTNRVQLKRTVVNAWIAEDQVGAVLSNEPAVTEADEERARAMLDHTLIDLPQALDWSEMEAYAKKHKTAGGTYIPPDNDHYSYYTLEVPVTILLKGNQRLVRLQLKLSLSAPEHEPREVVGYDLFPGMQTNVRKLLSGELKVDVSKGLKYVLAATAAPLVPAAECLGLKISAPFQWNSKQTVIQASARMSNPVFWYVLDKAIENGFAPNLIIRAPKNSVVTVNASLVGELREVFLGVSYRAQFELEKSNVYVLQLP
jgi:hypothetical protein